MKLIKERDAAQHGGGNDALAEKVGEMEDELYDVRQQLEEEQERAAALEADLQQARAGGGGAAELDMLRMEMEDLRREKERAETMLAQAMGQG